MTYEILDAHEWQVSRSGHSIKTGHGDERRIVCAFHGGVCRTPEDHKRFEQWIDDAHHICELHNAWMKPSPPPDQRRDGKETSR